MTNEEVDCNWCPSYAEFCQADRAGRVRLNIDGHETWLYENILPFKFALLGLVSSESYEERLRGLMRDDEEIFRKVHEKKGVDLILLPSQQG